MFARIFCPARNALQSGQAKANNWLLDYVPAQQPRSLEPLMGWTSSNNTRMQVRLRFETKEAAIAYAQREGIAYRVEEPQAALRRAMAYSDNFRSDRIATWTH